MQVEAGRMHCGSSWLSGSENSCLNGVCDKWRHSMNRMTLMGGSLAELCFVRPSTKHHQNTLGHQAGFMWHWSAVGLAQLNHEFAYFSGAVLDLPQLQTRKYSFSFGQLPDQQQLWNMTQAKQGVWYSFLISSASFVIWNVCRAKLQNYLSWKCRFSCLECWYLITSPLH